MKKLERPASLDRLDVKKSKADLWYDQMEAEVRYLMQWKKNQELKGGSR